ncbi:hypothetical protein [uncultured Jatrophihabitans sp.]|uniref:hypothetical protein n=1 Tax=uncultured Jatrophihabitans sp. TaxID=1610747 RepID=UPI0035CC1E29
MRTDSGRPAASRRGQAASAGARRLAPARLVLAAGRALLNAAAGLVLRLVLPYGRGENVRLPAAGTGDGALIAEVVRFGLCMTTLATERGLIVVPNSRMFSRADTSSRPAR